MIRRDGMGGGGAGQRQGDEREGRVGEQGGDMQGGCDCGVR
jgi:hypothetical protein